MIEYRICWNAGSNISFRGATEWIENDGFEETAAELEDALMKPEGADRIAIPRALEEALEGSGFDYWVETRVVDGSLTAER